MSDRWVPLAPLVSGLAVPVRLDATGVAGPTRGQARGRSWRRTSKGWYVPSEVGRIVEQRILEQSMRLSGGAVTGWASLRLHGGGFFDGLASDGRTELAVPLVEGTGRIDPHPEIVVSREPLEESEVVVLHGVRCTTVERSLFDEMRRIGELREAVVCADMTFAATLTSIRRMRVFAAPRGRWRRSRLVGPALALAHEGSWSPAESRLRLIWVLDAGWSTPWCNRSVRGPDGRLLGIPDLLDIELGVAGEYDGADHRTRERHQRDVRRKDLFQRAGLESFTVVGGDLHAVPLIIERMEATRARSGRLPRAWTVDAEESLDARLDRRDRRDRLRALRAS